MSRSIDHSISLLLAVLALAFTGSASAQTNSLTDLGPYGPAVALNDTRQLVLGPLPSVTGGTIQNYLCSAGTLTSLPQGFVAMAINSAGNIAGEVVSYYRSNQVDG